MVDMPVYAYIIIGVLCVGAIVWGFMSNSKAKKNKTNKKTK